jgi:hypothetical protein
MIHSSPVLLLQALFVNNNNLYAAFTRLKKGQLPHNLYLYLFISPSLHICASLYDKKRPKIEIEQFFVCFHLDGWRRREKMNID